MQHYSHSKDMKTEMKFYTHDGLTQVYLTETAFSHFLTEGGCFTFQASGSSVGSTLWISFLLLLEAALLAVY